MTESVFVIISELIYSAVFVIFLDFFVTTDSPINFRIIIQFLWLLDAAYVSY